MNRAPREPSGQRRRGWLLAVLTLLLAAAFLGHRLIEGWEQAQETTLAQEDTVLGGSWQLDPAGGTASADRQNRRRVQELALPYAPGTEVASEATGVTFAAPEGIQPGLNLYVSGHGPEAILMDLAGRTLHRWRLPYGRALGQADRPAGSAFWRRVLLLPDGSLFAMFQDCALVRMDRDSRLLWARPGVFSNHLMMAAFEGIAGGDELLWTVTKELREDPELGPRLGQEGAFLEDFVVALDPADGSEVARWSLLEALAGSPLRDLLTPAAWEDVFHTNTLTPLTPSSPQAQVLPAFAEGELLISLREQDLIGVLDLDSARFLWAWRGPWHRQHQPIPGPGRNLLLFDNRGRDGRARVLELDPVERRVVAEVPPPEAPPLSSFEAGSVQLLANGNWLVTESARGRALEWSPGGEVVWEWRSPHRAGPRDELVATLFEMVRLEGAGWPPWEPAPD